MDTYEQEIRQRIHAGLPWNEVFHGYPWVPLALLDDHARLRTRVAALEAALRKYGAHHLPCPAVWKVADGRGLACTCGLDALLATYKAQP